jgi:hypothetical protein
VPPAPANPLKEGDESASKYANSVSDSRNPPTLDDILRALFVHRVFARHKRVAPVSIDHDVARSILEKAWATVGNDSVVAPAHVVADLEAVIAAKDVTFKYILVTGLLGKCAEPTVHPRAIQTSSKLKNSYDARSLCHDVVVPFEKTKGDLWGLSNEPFVNKPARHPEHSKDNAQLRNRNLAEKLHQALEFADKASRNDVFGMLVHVLRMGKLRAESQITATVDVETTFRRVVDFVEQFLQHSDGGARLASIVGAFITLVNEGFTVKVYPPNYSDRFAGTAGDVEIRVDKTVLSAFECKDRPISLDDIRHGIRKARETGVSEYNFIGTAGLVAGQEDESHAEILASGANVDLHLFDIRLVAPGWAAALNPVRRKRFGETVTRILRDEMHRSEAANQAAELWNQLK